MNAETERWLGHFDMFLHAKNRSGNEYDLKSALQVLKDCKVAGTSEAIETEQRWIVQLAEIQIQDKAAILLFLGIDKERAEAIYGNVKTLNLRELPKNDDEGVAVSAHLVIAMEASSNSGRYYAVLEEVEGLSRSRIIPYLKRLINKKVGFIHASEDGKETYVDCNIGVNVILDKPIGAQLENARLVAVDLLRKPSARTIDKTGEFYEKARSIQFKPTHVSRGQRAKRIINEIMGRDEAADYPEIRIRIEEVEGPERTVSVDRFKHNALQSAFQLRTVITGIRPPMPEATSKIIKRLADKMVDSLK